MARTLTPPTSRIPIGTVEINGQRYDVSQHPEFTRWFTDLQARAGGTEALTNAELADIAMGAQLGVFNPHRSPPEPVSIAQIAAFMPRRQDQAPPLADASAVLCNRVFARR